MTPEERARQLGIGHGWYCSQKEPCTNCRLVANAIRAAVEQRDREWKAAVHVGATPETAAAKIQEQQDAAVEQAVERERERCALIAQLHYKDVPLDDDSSLMDSCGAIAAAIREGKP